MQRHDTDFRQIVYRAVRRKLIEKNEEKNQYGVPIIRGNEMRQRNNARLEATKSHLAKQHPNEVSGAHPLGLALFIGLLLFIYEGCKPKEFAVRVIRVERIADSTISDGEWMKIKQSVEQNMLKHFKVKILFQDLGIEDENRFLERYRIAHTSKTHVSSIFDGLSKADQLKIITSDEFLKVGYKIPSNEEVALNAKQISSHLQSNPSDFFLLTELSSFLRHQNDFNLIILSRLLYDDLPNPPVHVILRGMVSYGLTEINDTSKRKSSVMSTRLIVPDKLETQSIVYVICHELVHQLLGYADHYDHTACFSVPLLQGNEEWMIGNMNSSKCERKHTLFDWDQLHSSRGEK